MTEVIGRRSATNRPDPGRIGRHWSAVCLTPVNSFDRDLCSLLVGLVGLVAGRRSIGRSPLLYRGDQSTNGDQWPSERGFDGTAVASPLHPTEIRNGLQGIAKARAAMKGEADQ